MKQSDIRFFTYFHDQKNRVGSFLEEKEKTSEGEAKEKQPLKQVQNSTLL